MSMSDTTRVRHQIHFKPKVPVLESHKFIFLDTHFYSHLFTIAAKFWGSGGWCSLMLLLLVLSSNPCTWQLFSVCIFLVTEMVKIHTAHMTHFFISLSSGSLSFSLLTHANNEKYITIMLFKTSWAWISELSLHPKLATIKYQFLIN